MEPGEEQGGRSKFHEGDSREARRGEAGSKQLDGSPETPTVQRTLFGASSDSKGSTAQATGFTLIVKDKHGKEHHVLPTSSPVAEGLGACPCGFTNYWAAAMVAHKKTCPGYKRTQVRVLGPLQSVFVCVSV